MKHLFVFLLLGFGTVMSMAANAQDGELHRVTGFRSAQFGMTADEVRAAIERDFGLTGAAIREIENEREATLVLNVTVPQLEPGPGPAEIYYILGALSQQLMHVNVVWSTPDDPSADERDRIGIAGMQLARYFTELNWKPDGWVTGVSDAPGEVLLFAGVDPRDAGVEVLVRGIPTTAADGSTFVPDEQALLRVSYTRRIGQPDVVEVREGQF